MVHNNIAKSKSLSPLPEVSGKGLHNNARRPEYKGAQLSSVIFEGEGKELDPRTKHMLSMMLSFIQANFFMSAEDLQDNRRNKHIHLVRWFFIAKMYKHFRTLKECGSYINRNHSTIIISRDKYQQVMSSKYPSWEKWVFTQMEMQWLIFQNHEKNKINEVPPSQGEGVDDSQVSGQGHQDNF